MPALLSLENYAQWHALSVGFFLLEKYFNNIERFFLHELLDYVSYFSFKTLTPDAFPHVVRCVENLPENVQNTSMVASGAKMWKYFAQSLQYVIFATEAALPRERRN